MDAFLSRINAAQLRASHLGELIDNLTGGCVPANSNFSCQLHTNLGRSHSFGWFLQSQPPRYPDHTSFRWARIGCSDNSKITGIFFDAVEQFHKLYFSGFGVVQDPSASSQIQEPPCFPLFEIIPHVPSIQRSRGHHFLRESFLSVASLDNISLIQFQRAGPRCVGMLVTYGDGSAEALGRWNPENKSWIPAMFAYPCGPGATILF